MATKNIMIGSIKTGMTANGASPYIFRQIFGRDFVKACAEGTAETEDFVKMGFVMAMQHEHGTTAALKKNTDDFVLWLERFGMLDPEKTAAEIAELCAENEATSSSPKTAGV